MMRMVAPPFSGEVTVENVLFWSANVGINRMAVSPAAFNRAAVLRPALVVCTSPVQEAAVEGEEEEEGAWGGVT